VPTGGTGSSALGTEQLIYAGGRLFVVNDGSDTLGVFAVNATTGALTAYPSRPVALGFGTWLSVGAHPSGSPVIRPRRVCPQACELRHHADHGPGCL
jgi:hypothetical protein